ncbi:single-stranded DNA-binding protein WHY1, chloroplastic-like [Spinacia oleracea]|uniref:Single-stranded DNA-binding protein WHY1, chloroplastic-like n=1 Tax=Spinacia oleracea TaxID=3562 RepID=A0ABM3QRG0_SPIOL|nr:single-stranded DNA-binding protein WHY1, chloroplastic-like [Spinacia oleracea]
MVQQLLSSPSNFTIGTQLQGPTSLSSHNSISTKASHFKLSKNWVSHVSSSKLSLSVKCRQSSEYFDKSPPRFSPSYSANPPTLTPGGAPKVFVGHSIYKGKAALTVEPKAPEFLPLDLGAFKVSREGYVLLQFAPAAGVRQYDWSRKQVFSLSVTEIGSLVSLGSRDSCEFFHDPNKGKRNAKVAGAELSQQGFGAMPFVLTDTTYMHHSLPHPFSSHPKLVLTSLPSSGPQLLNYAFLVAASEYRSLAPQNKALFRKRWDSLTGPNSVVGGALVVHELEDGLGKVPRPLNKDNSAFFFNFSRVNMDSSLVDDHVVFFKSVAGDGLWLSILISIYIVLIIRI